MAKNLMLVLLSSENQDLGACAVGMETAVDSDEVVGINMGGG